MISLPNMLFTLFTQTPHDMMMTAHALGRAQLLEAVLAALLGRWPRALGARRPLRARRALRPEPSAAMAASLCWRQAASDSSGALVDQVVQGGPRVDRTAGESKQGAPSTLAGRPGHPGWAARATLAGQGCPARAVRLGTASQPGSGDPAPLAGSHQPYGRVGADQAGWRPPRLVGHIRTLATYVHSLPSVYAPRASGL